METEDVTTQKEIYYVISFESNLVPEGDPEPSILIEGKPYKKDAIFVAKRFEGLTSIYTYFPNYKVWFPNSGVHNSFWCISMGYEPMVREEISREYAYELADGMRDYVVPVAEILIRLHAETVLPY